MAPYRYGEKRAWELVLDAVRELGGTATQLQVADYVSERIPDFARTNVGADLRSLSVNCRSRGHYGVNRKPRVTDSGSPYDQLFQVGGGRGVRFAIYDPNVHGIWQLVDEGGNVLVPKFLHTVDNMEMATALASAEQSGLFDLEIDTRTRTLVAMVQRDGQPAFRQGLLTAYDRTCAISGCTVEALLEAAHIIPYAGSHSNLVTNGLLLRADIHKLFDLHLFYIDPLTLTVRLSEILRGTEYQQFGNAQLRAPLRPEMIPHRDALKHHQERCSWLNAVPPDAPEE